MSKLTWLFGGAVLVVVAAGVTATLFWAPSGSPDSPSIERPNDRSASDQGFPAGVTAEDFARAERVLREQYQVDQPTETAVYLVLGEQAGKAGDYQQAIACYHRIPTEDPVVGLTSRLEEGLSWLELNHADQAESSLREFLDAARVAPRLQPAQVADGFKHLTYILSVEIRQEDRKPILEEQHAIGLADPLDSKQLFFPNLLILNSPAGNERIDQFLEQDSENPKLLAARARYDTLAGEFEQAIDRLIKLRQEYPDNLTMAANLAEAFFEIADMERLDRLLQSLPPHAATEPWLLTRMRGESALENQQWDEALQYFQAVLAHDPANPAAQMGVARAYAGLEQPEMQQEALQRSSVLAEIRVNLSSVQSDAVAASEELSEKCRSIGMERAASVFAEHARAIAQYQQQAEADGSPPSEE